MRAEPPAGGGPVPLAPMEQAAARQERPGRWSTIAWLATTALVTLLLVGAWMRIDDERSGVSIANALVRGERPEAPQLPTRAIEGDGAPGLPRWYERAAGGQPAEREVLVVNWWASWCGPCEEEAPALADVAADYRGRATVVGLNAGAEDLEADAREFVQRHQLRFPIVRGTRADKDAWGVGGFPETFVVGVDGRISAHVNGPIDEHELRALLDRELRADRS